MPSLEQKVAELEKRVALLESRADAPSARCAGEERPGTGAGADRSIAHFRTIQDVWPQFTMHPKAWEAFERHVKTMKGEPKPEKIRQMLETLDTNRHYGRTSIELLFGCTKERAQAFMYFAKISGLAIYDAPKGLIRKTNE